MIRSATGVAARQVFLALADQTRCALLEALLERNGQSASHLAQPMRMSRQAVSRHLRILERAGLVLRSREGKQVIFELRRGGLVPADRYLRTLLAAADRPDHLLD